MADWVDLTRGIALPRYCDHYGHMNVRYYAQFFDDAGWHILNLAGIAFEDIQDRGLGTVVVNVSIDFHHELVQGKLFVIRGGYTRVGTKSFHHELRLYEADTMTHCATQTSVEVFFDTKARKAVEIPDDLKEKMAARVVAAD
ncbi:MAG: thioesterase family protein [Rhodospirillales bacterium]|nr:thioesterase family protein [Rhodospirillales bacterium]